MIILKNVNIETINEVENDKTKFIKKEVTWKDRVNALLQVFSIKKKINPHEMQFDANNLTPGGYSSNTSTMNMNLKPTIDHDSENSIDINTQRNGAKIQNDHVDVIHFSN